jgi:hypothetical protein
MFPSTVSSLAFGLDWIGFVTMELTCSVPSCPPSRRRRAHLFLASHERGVLRPFLLFEKTHLVLLVVVVVVVVVV